MTTRQATHEEEGLQTYLNDVGEHHILTRDEEVALFQRLENGDESARDDIVRCNLRFVIKIALQFKGLGIPVSDLIQEGNVGLLHVIEKFEWRKGFRFSTYAAYYIRQEIQAALHRNSSMIRLPVRKARKLARISELTRVYNEREGRDPSNRELATELDVTKDEIELLLSLRHSFTSMDAEWNDEGLSLQDSIPSEDAPLFESLDQEQTRQVVEDALDLLTEREKNVIQLRYGMNASEKDYSLRGASKVIGLSQEGVRRVEHRALDKLRRPAVASRFEGLLTA